MGCKETLPVRRAGGREKTGDQHRQGVSACLTLSPFSSHNLAPASPAPAVGLGAVGVPQARQRWEGQERKRFEVAGDRWHSWLRRQREETP